MCGVRVTHSHFSCITIVPSPLTPHLDAAPRIGGDVVLGLQAGLASRLRPRRRPRRQRRFGNALCSHRRDLPHLELLGVVAAGLCLQSQALLELVQLPHKVQIGRNDGAVSANGESKRERV